MFKKLVSWFKGVAFGAVASLPLLAFADDPPGAAETVTSAVQSGMTAAAGVAVAVVVGLFGIYVVRLLWRAK